MKRNYQKIIANEMLSDEKGYISRGVLNVSPDIFFLMKDDDVRDLVIEQLEIVDELKEGERVEVYRGDEYLGEAKIVEYPMASAENFATVRFCDDGVISTLYVVNVAFLKPLTPEGEPF